MKILVSFVNQVFSPELKLGLLDTKDGVVTWVTKGIQNIGEGATGIVFGDKDRIYVCIQLKGLVVYDFSFNVVQYYEFIKVKDPHTIIYEEDSLFVVSSGTNEIYKLLLNEKGLIVGEELYWKTPKLPNYREDFVHLNSVRRIDGELIASKFGIRKGGENWKNSESGNVFKLSENTSLIDDIKQPHTLYDLNGKLIVCESKTGKVLNEKGEEILQLEGYTRGICHDEKYLFVASSAKRKISKSTKKFLKGRTTNSENASICSKLYVIDIKSMKISEIIKLGHYGQEIYDICILPNKIKFKKKDGTRERIKYLEENFSAEIAKSKENERQFLRSAETIRNRENTIKGKEREIQSCKQEIEKCLAEIRQQQEEQVNKLNVLLRLIKKVREQRVIYNPIQKYKAYKMLLNESQEIGKGLKDKI